ncbi:hypothetical protein [Herpetosiphon giganteus]|uniref:hypothetical protein n=1 Tax=Herpetosiphon giganteus TaxID=2029754 RepID=UPI00195C9586|nr:hypothetical protein [Herpetosiphon giganteus]MBM7843080.1 hypothetical protein [Herpetosiphon giganteus]
MRWLSYCWALIVLFSCTQADQTPPTAQQFAIYIFNQDAVPGLGPTAETAWQILQVVPLEQAAFTVTEELLLSYHWPTQTITFTNPWGQTSIDAPFYMVGGDGAFVVVYAGQRLFGGKVVAAISPRRFEYPAMALSNDYILMESPELQGKLVYSFHPKSAVMYPPQAQFLADDPVIAEAVKNHLRQLGKLVE